MRIAITSESVCDLDEQMRKKYDIQTVPFGVVLGDEEYYDGEFPTAKIFNYVDKTKKLPSTSAVNEFQYAEFFNNVLKNNDCVIHISMSDQLSSSYNNAVNVAKTMKNVFVINSKSLSFGMALLLLYACELKEKGLLPEEIVEGVEKIKEKVHVSLILEKLDYLKKGGRCSSLQLLGANLLMLRPELIVVDGKICSAKKFRGNFKKCVGEYCDDILQKVANPNLDLVFLAYTTLEDDIKNMVRIKLEERGFKNIIEAPVGSTIACHCGENGLGLIFMNK